MAEPVQKETSPREAKQEVAAPPSRVVRSTAFETALIVGGVVLFLVLLYAMRDFLNPPLIGAALVLMVWPLRQQTSVRALLISGGFLLGLWFLSQLSTILIPFVTVYLLAYLFDPLVTYLLKRFQVPRWASSLVVTALLIGIVALLVLLLVPNLIGEFKTLLLRLVEGLETAQEWILTTPLLTRLDTAGLIDKQEVTTRLSTLVKEQAAAMTSSLPNMAQDLFRSIGSLLAAIMLVGIVPVLLFFTLKDYPFIKVRLVELFPTFGGRRDYLVEAGGIMGNYLRGQLTISAIATVIVSTLLVLFNVPFALLIGLLAGILNMIPNLGNIITNVIGILIAVIFGDPWFLDALIVFLVLLGQSFFEQTILTPNILSSHVGLHPVLIVLSLFVFGYFLGIFGLLIAVPATAVLMTIYKANRDNLTLDLASAQQRRTRRFFTRRVVSSSAPETPAGSDTPS